MIDIILNQAPVSGARVALKTVIASLNYTIANYGLATLAAERKELAVQLEGSGIDGFNESQIPSEDEDVIAGAEPKVPAIEMMERFSRLRNFLEEELVSRARNTNGVPNKYDSAFSFKDSYEFRMKNAKATPPANIDALAAQLEVPAALIIKSLKSRSAQEHARLADAQEPIETLYRSFGSLYEDDAEAAFEQLPVFHQRNLVEKACNALMNHRVRETINAMSRNFPIDAADLFLIKETEAQLRDWVKTQSVTPLWVQAAQNDHPFLNQ